MTPPARPVDDPRHDFPGRGFLLALSIVLLVATLFVAWGFKGATVFALLLGFLLHPVYAWLKPRVKWKPLAAGIVLVLVAVALVVPFIVLTVRLVDEAQAILSGSKTPQSILLRLERFLTSLGLPQGFVEDIRARVGGAAMAGLEGFIVPAVTAITHFLLGLVLFFVLLYYVLIDGPRLVDYVRRNLPLDKERAEHLLERIGGNVKAIFLGTIGVAAIQGALAALGWWVLGLPQPVFWGFVMMLFEIVPVLGAFVVLIPAAIWAFAQGNMFAGVGLLVLNFLMVGIVDDVVRPYLIGRQSGVHPAVILVGIAGGILVFGAIGFVLGPLVVSLLGPVIEAWAHPRRASLAPDEPDGPEESDEASGNP